MSEGGGPGAYLEALRDLPAALDENAVQKSACWSN
jgi:hypothetical protein